MKNILVGLAVLLLGGCATDFAFIPPADRGKPFEFVQEVPGKSKDEIFSAAKAWIAETFVSAKAVTEDADKESGRIIGNGSIKYDCNRCFPKRADNINFTMRIDVKDGKFKTTFTNYRLYSRPSGYGVSYSAGGESDLINMTDFNAVNTGFARLSSDLYAAVMAEKTKADF